MHTSQTPNSTEILPTAAATPEVSQAVVEVSLNSPIRLSLTTTDLSPIGTVKEALGTLTSDILPRHYATKGDHALDSEAVVSRLSRSGLDEKLLALRDALTELAPRNNFADSALKHLADLQAELAKPAEQREHFKLVSACHFIRYFLGESVAYAFGNTLQAQNDNDSAMQSAA